MPDKKQVNKSMMQHWQSLVDGLPGYCFCYFQKSGEFYLNPLLQALHQNVGAVAEGSFLDLFGDHNAVPLKKVLELLEKKDQAEAELEIFQKKANTVTLRISVRKHKHENEIVLLGIGQDITHHTFREIELEKWLVDARQELEGMRGEVIKANKEAKTAGRAKSGFLANMSHELRTPLNAIIGYSEILLEDLEFVEKDQLESDLSKITVAGKHLLSMINDILDLSKIESGRMQLTLEYFSVDQIVERVIETVADTYVDNSNKIVKKKDSEFGVVLSDLNKLRQICLNLVSNAAKFTENGEITLSAHREIQGEDEFIYITVSDNGVGMDEAQIRRLFYEYYQGDSAKQKRWQGTGLGLVISQRYAQLMGGDIKVESEMGKGSTFTLKIPTNTAKVRFQDHPDGFVVGPKVDPRLVRFAPNDEFANRRSRISRVLIIDDDPNVRDLMERYLSREGFETLSVDNGMDGIRKIEEFQPDVITLDVMMPVMDGWSVLSELKQNEKTKHLPVIMLSMLDEGGTSFALGASDYLLKPIKRDTLVDTVLRHMRNKKHSKVLVVDDEENNQHVIKKILNGHGIEVEVAENGIEALTKMHESEPDLILLDLLMPKMDGFKFSEEVRRRSEWAEIPIVVVTAKDLSEEDLKRLNGNVERIYERGKQDFQTILRELQNTVVQTLREQNARNKAQE